MDAQYAEKEFAWPSDILKHRFIDHQSRILRRPERRLCVFRVFRQLETPFPGLCSSRFFYAQDAENEFA
jgi:hypothetical protein